jgi:putative FmdB family regulatory protein
MPIYEFECLQCHKVSEILLMPAEERPTLCPHCGGKLQKRISSPAIQFKGSGWYITDYARRNSPGGKDSKEVKESKEAMASAETKDSKPAENAPAPTPQDTPSKAPSPAASKKES